jgi:hypothetical protein
LLWISSGIALYGRAQPKKHVHADESRISRIREPAQPRGTALPAIRAAGVPTPARIYDLRSTFASNALAAGIAVFELAKIMGTSVAMIERAYGTLLDGAGAGIASRLAKFEAEQDQAEEAI